MAVKDKEMSLNSDSRTQDVDDEDVYGNENR